MRRTALSVAVFSCFLAALFLPVNAFASGADLADKPCMALYDNMTTPDGKPKSQDQIKQDMLALWQDQIYIFIQDNPDVYRMDPNKVNDLGSEYQKVFNFIMQKACARGSLLDPLGEKIQNALAAEFGVPPRKKGKNNSKQANEDCRIIKGKDAEYFGLTGGAIDVCTDAIYTKFKISEASEQNRKALKYCVWPVRDEKAGKDKVGCKVVEGSKEQQCLSTYGECKKKENGICGWVHTEKSKACL